MGQPASTPISPGLGLWTTKTIRGMILSSSIPSGYVKIAIENGH